MQRTPASLTVPLLALIWAGCSGEIADSPAGDMGDVSYYRQRSQGPRINASGAQVSIEQFSGSYVWADYAAPWCRPCIPQTRAIKEVARSVGRDVVFLTIMTSDLDGYGDPATRATAQQWASRYRLDPDLVLAADLTAMTIPKNILYSPDGHVLFEKTGLMSVDEIQSVLTDRMDDWNDWHETGVLADWMR